MLGTPGFQFDTGTATSRHSALSLLNQGSIQGIDFEAEMFLYEVPGSTTIDTVPAADQVISSKIVARANNIVNEGAMSVGNNGLLSLAGKNVDTSYGTLAAGTVGTAGVADYVDNITGIQGQFDDFLVVGGPYFYINSPDVFDLCWGVTNGLTQDTSGYPDSLPGGLLNIL